MASQSNKSLIDGLSVLSYLANHGSREPVGCREAARQLGMNTTRVNRLLMTLKEVGMAEQTDAKKYVPGPGIHVLAAQCMHGSKLLNRAFKALQRNTEITYRTALGVLWHNEVSYLVYSDLSKGISAGWHEGPGVYPAELSTIGRVLLSNRNDADIDALYRNHPGIDVLELKKTLVEARHFGYAIIKHENSYNIAIPISRNFEAAISFVNVPLDVAVETALMQLRAIAADITSEE